MLFHYAEQVRLVAKVYVTEESTTENGSRVGVYWQAWSAVALLLATASEQMTNGGTPEDCRSRSQVESLLDTQCLPTPGESTATSAGCRSGRVLMPMPYFQQTSSSPNSKFDQL